MLLKMIFFFTLGCCAAYGVFMLLRAACKHWQVRVGAPLILVLLLALVYLPGALGEEIRTCWVKEFDLSHSTVVVIDEDGFKHPVPLQAMDYELEEEFELYINDELIWLVEI